MAMTVMKHTIQILVFVLALLMVHDVRATITGLCSDCHTMHNSQGGDTMELATETDDSPKIYLLRGTCLGCHAQGTGQNIVSIGSNDVPQVYHTAGTDLAGGNFKYADGDNKKGHNLVDFGNNESIDPPGKRHDLNGNRPWILTCAGDIGCHGFRRQDVGTGLVAMKGSHHNNTGNNMDTANTVANSYRFLYWVKGLENNGQGSFPTRWQNASSTDHNEYLGADTPMDFNDTDCQTCHDGSNNARPTNSTISGFCATCHGYFHMPDSPGFEGVGDDNTSPFKRHPTDVVLPGGSPDTEYESYTVYDPNNPVARQDTFDFNNMSSTVSTGPAGDVVMCLSCHVSHASNNYMMLRWDYKSSISGCTVCHTSKN